MATSSTNKIDDATVTRQASEAAHEAVDRATEIAEEVERQLRQKIDEIRDSANDRVKQAKKQSHDFASVIGDYVDEKPVMALGIAFVAGIVLSSMMRGK
ncbi:MAG: hypothetical protein DHS20C01_02580 [marine bacterium B5-7]|nr:MAG: hypothetical protein DHS20C01_02580 [marine bacterium B5-7]